MDRRLPRCRAVSTWATVHPCGQNAELKFELSRASGRLVWDAIRLTALSTHSTRFKAHTTVLQPERPMLASGAEGHSTRQEETR